MTPQAIQADLRVPTTLPEALDALADLGPEGAPFAGGTWIMRAPLRREPMRRAYVALRPIAELQSVAQEDASLKIGASVTHARLAEALADMPDLAALRSAAARSANPAVRSAATLGGNLATHEFAAADLVSALLCLGAEVEIAAKDGVERMPLERFLELRRTLEPGRIVAAAIVPRGPKRSAHARLPLRVAGDYPVAIVSVAVEFRADRTLSKLRIAVGSVETTARRWTSLEQALDGRPLDPDRMAEVAAAQSDDFAARDGVEAPGWYRVAVLPALVRRAATALSTS